MRTQPKKPKLTLKKKTLSALDEQALSQVLGGRSAGDPDPYESQIVDGGTCGTSGKIRCTAQHNRRALRISR